jgi:hypothetical protein
MSAIATSDPLTELREFDRNAARADRYVRGALHANCGAFLDALLNERAFNNDDPAFRFAIGILYKSNALAPALATPANTSMAQSVRLTRCMLELDNNFLNVLLTALLTRHDMGGSGCALRVLELVSEFPDYPVNWRSLIRIHADGDKATRNKCVTLLAQVRFGDSGAIESFKRSDPRVRANIIEALWGIEREKANACLELAINDEDNRVAGNACLALYNAGDSRALARLSEMLESEDPKHRMTAAWVIGQCGDGRFAGQLLKALRDKLPAVRKNSIASLARIEAVPASTAIPRTANACEVELCFVTAPLAVHGSDGFELWLDATAPGGEFAAHLRPVDFFVWAGAELLLEYSVEESVHTGDVAVGIVYPAGSEPLEKALKDSLAKKPAGHGWALSTYGASRKKIEVSALPLFESSIDTLTALLDSGPALSGGAAEAVNKLLQAESGFSERHMLLILDGPGSEPGLSPETLGAVCQEKQIRLHCWRLWQGDAASAWSGLFVDEKRSASLWPRFISSLSARYTLRTRRAPTAVALRKAGTKPVRFSGCIDLIKGDQNA